MSDKSPAARAHEAIDALACGCDCDPSLPCHHEKEAHAAVDEALREARHKAYGEGYNHGKRRKEAKDANQG